MIDDVWVDSLFSHVRYVADEIGLKDWKLEFSVTGDMPEAGMETPPGSDWVSLGSCEPVPGQRRAYVRFHPDFFKEPAEHRRAIIVHELVHCHLAHLREFMRTGICDHLAQATYDALMFGFDQEWELTVDIISRAWAEKLPLVKWPEFTD